MGLKKYKGTAVVSVDQMRRSDAYTIEHYVSGRELMYRAAYGVFQAYADWNGRSIAILVGGGNNGGDGYALAGILMENGIPSTIYKVSEKLSEDQISFHTQVALDCLKYIGSEVVYDGEE